MLADFHTHSFLSDGELLPAELIRRAQVNGYTLLGISDHASASNLEILISSVRREVELFHRYVDDIRVLIGVELTHIPPASIPELARQAKTLGAQYVVVHGESPVEPVAPGTNAAAVRCDDVDILAHPGLLRMEDAIEAAQRGIFVEISSRGGHSLGNGRVVSVGRQAGVKFLINSDSHAPDDLHTPDFVQTVGFGAGLSAEEFITITQENPLFLLQRVGIPCESPILH
ncbi:MAG TPA: histidinol phosphate phosphatase domain-containing protein [Armatimonadota bacterium]|nr:histidinol phosphate phosphatase domain-containing protein [Armatimonadota bacterium]